MYRLSMSKIIVDNLSTTVYSLSMTALTVIDLAVPVV
jgi:hypothetical protein